MKYLLFIGIFFTSFISAQRHEIGGKIGSSNLIGDIGKTNYLQISSEGVTRTPILINAFYKRNFNPYQGIKLSIAYHSVYFNDRKAKETYRYNRNLKNSNEVLESAITFEYNFFPINNEVKQNMWSPYIFGGVSALFYDQPSTQYTVTQNNGEYIITPQAQNSLKKITGSIPFGLGMKYKFSYNWTIYGEITFRPTFTDDLDYNNIENLDYGVVYQNIPEANIPEATDAFNQYIQNNKVGNLNSKDWLNSISVGISYSFGRPPCYCD